MFRQIFLFELKYRLRRPGVYLCFAAALLFPFLSFSTGSLPANDKEFFNSPSVLAFYTAVTSMMMMLISSAIMGVPLYRDIEYNTRDYYLSYPITKAGYFWGRFSGSFFVVGVIAAAIPIGAWLGSLAGPAFHWQEASRYGPQRFSYYLHPYLTIAIPNLIFTSSLFFGLVAATRNAKVIYSSGILLFLGYMISNFVLHGTRNLTIINLSDPFAITPVRIVTGGYSLTQKNNSLVSIHGSFLANRIIWPGIGLVTLLVIYARFSFEKFFSGRQDKRSVRTAEPARITDAARITDPVTAATGNNTAVTAVSGSIMTATGRLPIPATTTQFTGSYHRRTLFTLTKIEILNIIRDNYFWIILSCGAIFLCFAFANTWSNYDVQDFPLTTRLTYIFSDNFLFFVFIILIFYTGETMHRERVTRYAAINDSLPPPDWVLHFSKLLSLLVLAAFLAILPILLGTGVQLAKGFTRLDLQVSLTNLFVVTLPLFTAMVLFTFMLHTVINNKFAAHGIGIVIWVTLFLLLDSGKLDYRLLLYSYTPWFRWSDMAGMGPMLRPVCWFQLYWLLCGGLFLVAARLWQVRGVSTSFRERRRLARGRWNKHTGLAFGILLAGFLATGSYIYYNVSYLNNYLTEAEGKDRKAIFEQQLKRYENMPLPKVAGIRLYTDLFPGERKAETKAFITIVNRNKIPIDSLLLDGDNLTSYSLSYNGKLLLYTSPLSFDRGKFDWWRPQRDDAGYRMYRLLQPLRPGDSAQVEINSVVTHEGFTNNLSDAAFMPNGMFYNSLLPGLGYDAGDELGREDDRKKHHLSPKKWDPIPHGDPKGTDNLSAGSESDLFRLDLTVSTVGDQSVVAPGALEKEWKENGRNYYHYLLDKPGMYGHFGVLSARYTILNDTAVTADGRSIPVRIMYQAEHTANLQRILTACKDGLHYFSRIYGPYPFERLTVAECPTYGPSTLAMPGLIVYSENFGWNAHFTDPEKMDFCSSVTAAQVAGQWWGQQVAPNHTVGSGLVSDGLAEYSTLILQDQKGDAGRTKDALQQEYNGFNWGSFLARRRSESGAQYPLIEAHDDYLWKNKASIVLYGLGKLMGTDSLTAALREFHDKYSFRDLPPFAGSDDLYTVLRRHVPDSIRYYLEDTWEKTTAYDNKIIDLTAVPAGNDSAYRVTMKISVAKFYTDRSGKELPAATMNDFITIGIFGAAPASHALYLERHRFTPGEHTLVLIVHGKPARGAIDPGKWLMDKDGRDNEWTIGETDPGITPGRKQ